MPRILLLLLSILILTTQAAQAQNTGVWYDRTRSGHGLDLQQQGNTVFSPFFTYDENNEPVWYWFQGERVGNELNADLVRFRRVPGASPPVVLDATLGRVRLRFGVTACPGGQARPGAAALASFEFTIGAEQQAWCMEPLIPSGGPPESALSGNYFVATDSGWGVQAHFYRQNNALQSFQTLYFYDSANQPRWLVGSKTVTSTETELELHALRGYCRSCPAVTPQSVPAGSMRLKLVTPLPGTAHNRFDSSLRYPFGLGGEWHRSAQPLTLLSAPNYPDASIVATREGLLQGGISEGVQVFRNIPYAAAPVGALRWRAPQPAPAHVMVRDARLAGSACPQDEVGDGTFGGINDPKSEDCLQLNIWSKAVRGAPLKPVMFWIHGGGLSQGSAQERNNGGTPRYDGALLAGQDVVLVSINYRLGPLGYLVMGDFIGEFPDQPGAGNYGLLDQIQALTWVRDNIAQFGGDPHQVTIFGESAGGISTCALMASPRARGLFHRALMQSGGCPRNLPALTTSNAANQAPASEQGARLISSANCSTTQDRKACMRTLSWQELIRLGAPTVGLGRPGESYGLSVDGYALPQAPGAVFRAGTQAPVPMVIGVNEDENSTLIPDSGKPATVAAYEAEIRRLFPTIGTRVLEIYPASNYREPWLALADIYDDLRFICPVQQIAREHAGRGLPTYTYYFSYVSPRTNLQPFGAFHGGEIVFLFGPSSFYNADEALMSTDLRNYWTQFARSGNPGVARGFSWPGYSAGTQVGVELSNAGPRLMRDYRQRYCDFWGQFVVF